MSEACPGQITSLISTPTKYILCQIEAIGMSAYEEVYKNYDVILLGPQVSYKKAEIEEVTKMPIAVIAAYDYAVGNVANIMKQVDELYQ